MNEEIKGYLKEMNAIQERAYVTFLSKAEKARFRELARKVMAGGFTLKKRFVRNEFGRKVGCVWSAIPQGDVRERNSECKFIFTDNRPKNRHTLVSDCTTRALSTCLAGQMTYDEIESRQYALAAKRHTRRNTDGTWDIILIEHNYAKLNLVRPVKRSILARIISGSLSRPVVSHSSGHVAAIDNDGVHDTWDSRGGKCDALYVYSADLVSVREVLSDTGVETRLSTVLLPKAA